jgi:hypothetical protein
VTRHSDLSPGRVNRGNGLKPLILDDFPRTHLELELCSTRRGVQRLGMAKQRVLEIWQAAIDAGHPEWALLPYSQPEAIAEKRDRFFNGLPCQSGHVVPRISPSGHCTSCERSYSRQYVGLRRSTKAQATPPWLTDDDHAAIRARYDEAARLTLETGVPHHVDHVVPLKSKSPKTKQRNACGLHCPANLQVIPGRANVAKNCWFDDWT